MLSKEVLVNNGDGLQRFCSINIKVLNHQKRNMFEEIKYLSKLKSCQDKSCEGRDYATLLWKTRPTETERCMSKKEIHDYVKKRNYYASLLKKFKKL